jgi:hypothetical protein
MDYRARFYDPYINRFIQPDTVIPNLSNLQSLNRYSYVLNQPMNYTDPSGHAVCPYSECDIVVHPKTGHMQLRGNLYKAAEGLVRELGGKNDLEAMTSIIEAGAGAYRNFDRLLPQLSNIFLGVSEFGPGTLLDAALMSDKNGCAGVGREPRDCASAKYYFTDTGFHPDFRDFHNQPYHLWGYIANTAAPGNKANGLKGLEEAIFANIFHEYAQSRLASAGIMKDRGRGTSWYDFVLSEAGMEIGILITDQAITPAELAGVIRERIGPSGPGSAGVLQIYQDQYGPLYGTLNDWR